MTKTDWIVSGAFALALLLLITVTKLKIWHALVVFGGGVLFATTPPGAVTITAITRFLSSIH